MTRSDARTLPGVAVVVERAQGIKCARSWRYFDPATADPDYPDVTPRDAAALRELRTLGRLPVDFCERLARSSRLQS